MGEPGHIQQFLRGAVGLGGVERDLAVIADEAGDLFGQFADGHVRAGADVDQGGGVGVQADVDAGGGHVVDVQELAPGRAGAPEQDARRDGGMGGNAEALLDLLGDRAEAGGVAGDAGPVLGLGEFRQVEFADQGGQDVGGLQVEIVVRAVQVGGHDRDEGGAVLPVVGVALFHAGDFGDGVRRVRRLQRAGEQGVFPDRLGGEFGVDAGAAQEDQPPDPVELGLVEDVGLDHQVFVDELAAIDVVGVDAAHFGGGQEHALGAFSAKNRAVAA